MVGNKMIYYISDTHFYHENIIKICKRPYSTINEMNEDIVKKWNKKVKKGDSVFFLGDFSHKCLDEDAIKIVKELNGKKFFIKGNHDKSSFVSFILTCSYLFFL